MSISFLVTGHFANGRTRVAGIHLPAGRTTRDIASRKAVYARVFKQDIENAPPFEYIDITYTVTGHDTRRMFYALTPRAVQKLKACLNGSVHVVQLRPCLKTII